MIAHLSGTVLRARHKKVILDVKDVGYEVSVNRKLLTKMKEGDPLKLWIHTHQTSDSISFFGFNTEEELGFFELLTSVNGVGPRTALDILETPVDAVEKTIVAGDTNKLAETPGIGKKTAARIVLELKPKITGDDPEVPESTEVDEEILQAIEGLGYKKNDTRKILRKLPKEITETEEIVRWFLKNT
ncbi:MAG: Holliday junction branch migration protein RuvA [Patescibacteria group bacterium]